MFNKLQKKQVTIYQTEKKSKTLRKTVAVFVIKISGITKFILSFLLFAIKIYQTTYAEAVAL